MEIKSKENKRGNTHANITFVLLDMLETSLLNANECLKKEGCELRHESKHNFNTAITAIKKLKGHVNKCSNDMQVNYGNDSDMLYNVLLLLIDRCGEDDMKLFQFYNYIKSFPSKNIIEADDTAFSHLF